MKKLALIIALLLVALPLCADTFTMDNAAFVYSPCNWNVASGKANTINTGAYFRVIFSGTAASLTTDTTNAASPYTTMWARVDGGAWQSLALAAGNPTLSIATGLTNRKHLLEFIVRANSETLTRWAANSQVMVTLTGLVVDTGATLTAPIRRTKNVCIFGDSITEGTLVNGNGSPDTVRNDSIQDYAYTLGQAIDAEVGIIGFGGTGVITTAHTVPVLTSSYNYIYTGVSRSFAGIDLVILNEGTNDSGSIQSGLQTVMSGILASSPSTKILALIPLNGTHASEIQAAVLAVNSSNVTYASTTGWFNSADSSDGTHPYGYAHMALIAPKLIPVTQSLLYGATVGYAF